MKKRKFKKVSNHGKKEFRRVENYQKSFSEIPKIRTLGNSRAFQARQILRLPRINQILKFPTFNLNPCKQREDRRRALFRSGKAGKIKVRFAKWTLKSLIRCK